MKLTYEYDSLGNIERVITETGEEIEVEIPDYNMITFQDDLMVARAKQHAQAIQYENYLNGE